MKTALIIFVRNPELGKVKTRLAKDIGDVGALQVYKRLLQHTYQITHALACHKYVYYANEIVVGDLWLPTIYHKRAQAPGDLGQRMHSAFSELFGLGYKKVAIIGSDCLSLTTELIEEAFVKINESTAAIGPATDGGYYLLGLPKLLPQVFSEKPWSTADVFAKTIVDLEAAQLQVHRLPELTDIDTAADLEGLHF